MGILKPLLLGILAFALGFCLFYGVASAVYRLRRKRKKKKKPEEQPAKDAKPKINKMDIILIIIAVTLFVFTVKMISLFEQYQSVPDTLITAVFAVCGGECGVMGWIKTNNERYRERQWQLEDQAAINGNTGEV